VLVLKNKGAYQINDYWRPKSEERKVNEIHANAGGLNAELLAKPRADPKQLEFNQ